METKKLFVRWAELTDGDMFFYEGDMYTYGANEEEGQVIDAYATRESDKAVVRLAPDTMVMRAVIE